MVKKLKTINPFVNILKRSNDTIKDERAQRIGQSLKEAQIQLILELKGQVRAFEDRLSSMSDLSASNSSMDVNRVTDMDFAAFVSRYQTVSIDLELLNRKLAIAVNIGEQLYAIDTSKLFE